MIRRVLTTPPHIVLARFDKQRPLFLSKKGNNNANFQTMEMSYAQQMAGPTNGWLEGRKSVTMESALWRNAGPMPIAVAVDYVEN